ncbi:Flp pilus assembly protein TadG [Thermocatellispora tengchongensis]|uniref:Flp pilus assembly protein TadG n=1 Tax=Thermocatellispora tengchongensis TaxID=1073253 RepID=A0A840PIB3_9ACTN|nr:TadE family type IV pilus minor pilin [Thermocatellispora tengchongensis]MBB5137643.1 Flp pilus assembly protein TadG [Thermocatellispora tengchongensis]
MSGARPSRRGAGCRGSVTAETAAVLPALMAVLAGALWMVAVVGAQLECVDAARAGARAAARGESLEEVRRIAARLAPAGAEIAIDRGAETSKVEVSATVRPKWGEALPSVTVESVAVAATEPGAAS